MTGAAIAARQRVVAEAETATRLSQIVVAAAVVIGLLLTFLILFIVIFLAGSAVIIAGVVLVTTSKIKTGAKSVSKAPEMAAWTV